MGPVRNASRIRALPQHVCVAYGKLSHLLAICNMTLLELPIFAPFKVKTSEFIQTQTLQLREY